MEDRRKLDMRLFHPTDFHPISLPLQKRRGGWSDGDVDQHRRLCSSDRVGVDDDQSPDLRAVGGTPRVSSTRPALFPDSGTGDVVPIFGFNRLHDGNPPPRSIPPAVGGAPRFAAGLRVAPVRYSRQCLCAVHRNLSPLVQAGALPLAISCGDCSHIAVLLVHGRTDGLDGCCLELPYVHGFDRYNLWVVDL